MDDQGLELTDEERAYISWAIKQSTQGPWVTATIKLQARGDRAEWEVNHYECQVISGVLRNQAGPCTDSHHTWKAAQWIEAARQALTGREKRE